MTLQIEEIKSIRKKLNLTQHQLSTKSGVSQSLIAKIESKKIDPSYSSVIKIFNTLTSLSKNESKKASEIMQKKILTIKDNESIKETIKKMKKYQISQMPVLENETIVGMISENTLLHAFIEQKESLKTKDIMDQAPPIITKDTDIQVISNLLKFFQIILVAEKGKPIGIITKSDLIESIYN